MMQKMLVVTVLWVMSGALAAAKLAGSDETYTVKISTESPAVAVGGAVVPFREVALSAQMPGRVKSIAGVAGDRFDAGTVLIALDENELLAKRSAAHAQLNAADAQLRNAGVQYSRELWSPQSNTAPGGMGIPNMFEQMFMGPAEGVFGGRDRDAERNADLYASSTRIEQARSAILGAQAEINAIDAKLRDAKSQAPFDGVILQKFVEEGDTVQPGQQLVNFADLTWLQIEVHIPARLAQGLEAMMVLEGAATFDDHPDPVDVRVAQVYPMADVQRHTVKVKFDIPQGVSKPGMYAKVKIPDVTAPQGTRQLPTIPTTAIRYRGSLPIVYIQNAKGQPELRMVREGKRLPDNTTSVLSGIAEGDKVYVNPGPGIMNFSPAPAAQ